MDASQVNSDISSRLKTNILLTQELPQKGEGVFIFYFVSNVAQVD